MSETINITHVLWGGHKIFDYGEREPWVGIRKDKLSGLKEVEVVATGLKTAPVYQDISVKAFLTLSEAQGWVKKSRGRQINHVPLSELKKIAKSVRE